MSGKFSKLYTASGVVALVLLASSQNLSAAEIASDINVSRPAARPMDMYVAFDVGNADYDKANGSDLAFGVTGGIHITKIFAIELGWKDLGEVDKSGTTAESSLMFFDFMAKYNISRELRLYGKLGFTSWDYDIKDTGGSVSDSDGDFFYGFGFDYDPVTPNKMFFRAEVDFYDIGANFSGVNVDEEITLFSLGAGIKF